MINVAPGATYEATLQWTASGLAGTIGVRTLNNAGGTTQARVTAGIVEFPAGSGFYQVTLTAPGTKGQYTLLWDDGAVTPGHISTEELFVTATTPVVVNTGSLYVTRDQLKSTLSITGAAYDDSIDRAIDSASRALDRLCGRRFYPTSETRYYTPDPCLNWFPIDDIVSADAVTVDTGGSGTYDTTWTEGTDFYLSPANAPLVDQPFTKFELRYYAGRVFPMFVQRGVKVEGTFGWSTAPAQICEFAEVLAAKLMRRARDAPFGFVTHGSTEAATRLARTDPDFDALVGPYIRLRTIA